jgi:hypothetical protein
MLRVLMSWCVPNRALRFQSALTDRLIDQPAEEDVRGSNALLSALVSHGVAPGAPNTVPQYRS